jgi:REP-associated tyrosine transposase
MSTKASAQRRRSIRLAEFDYGQTGLYFVTLCVHDRKCLFGEIVDGAMQLNAIGAIVAAEWRRTPEIRPNVTVDEFVVMPNHFHALLAMESSGRGVLNTPSAQLHSPSQTLGAILRGFKASTTRYFRERHSQAPLWQRNYYEHVVRNDDELTRIREYILNNPIQWALDGENPEKGVYQYAPTDGIESIFGGVRP